MKRFVTAIAVLLVFLAVAFASATTGGRINYPKFKAWSTAGKPLTGGKLYSYKAGTSTAKSLYTDRELTTAATNPVVLDANGEATIFGSGLYKLVLKTSADVTLWTLDNVEGFGGGFGSDFYDVTDYDDDLCAAVTAIGSSTSSTIVVGHAITESSGCSIPKNITVWFPHGGSVSIASGKTITFNDASQVRAEPYQISTGSGSVAFTNGGTAFAEWWDDFSTGTAAEHTTALNAALASGAGEVTIATDGNVTVEGTIWMQSNTTLQAISKTTALKSEDDTASSAVISFGVSGFSGHIDEPYLKNLKVICNRSNATQQGLYLNGNYKANIRDVIIESCYGGGIYAINSPNTNGNWWLLFDNVDVFRSFNDDNTSSCVTIADDTNDVHFRGGRVKECNKFVTIGNPTYGHSDNSTETKTPSNISFNGVSMAGAGTTGQGRPPGNNSYGLDINGRFVTFSNCRYEDGLSSNRSDWMIRDWANGVFFFNNFRQNGNNIVFSETIGSSTDKKRRGQVVLMDSESGRGLTDTNSNDIELYNQNFRLVLPTPRDSANEQAIFTARLQDANGTQDTNSRVSLTKDSLKFGSGSGALDVGIKRDSDHVLKFVGTTAFESPASVAASATIDIADKGQLINLTSTSGVTISKIIFDSTDAEQGMQIFLRNADASNNSVTIGHTAGCTDAQTIYFKSGANLTLEKNQILHLIRWGDCWREVSIPTSGGSTSGTGSTPHVRATVADGATAATIVQADNETVVQSWDTTSGSFSSRMRGDYTVDGNMTRGANVYVKASADNSTSIVELRAETYGGVGDNATDNTAAFEELLAQCPDKGCRVAVSCGIWRGNIDLTKPNVHLEGDCGPGRATYWTTAAITPYDSAKPALKVSSIDVSGTKRPNSGVRISNLRLYGEDVGETGLHIQSCQYCTVDNVQIQGFIADGLKVGDSGNSASEFTTDLNFYNTSVTASYIATGTVNAVSFEKGSSWITNTNWFGGAVEGPPNTSGYTVLNGFDATFTGVYFQVPGGKGLHKTIASTNGLYHLVNCTVEGDAADAVIISQTYSDSLYHVLRASNTDFTGYFQGKNGLLLELTEHDSIQYQPRAYGMRHGGTMNFFTGIDANETNQGNSDNSTFIRRTTPADGSVLELYGANGIEAESPVAYNTAKAALYAVNTNATGGYAVGGRSYNVPFMAHVYQGDDTYKDVPWTAVRLIRGSGDTVANGFGTGIDVYLQDVAADSISAGVLQWIWDDATAKSSYVRFTTRLADVSKETFAMRATGSGPASSAYDGAHMVMGSYHLWIDDNATNPHLRFKASAPSSATDGTIIGP